MKVLFLILSLMIITSCGPSAEEIAQQEAALELAKAQEIAKKEQAALELAQAEEKRRSDIATVTCNIMAESRNMDGAMRIREINFGRENALTVSGCCVVPVEIPDVNPHSLCACSVLRPKFV